MTYPDARVAAHVNDHFVPTKLLGADHRDLSKAFNIRWFPGLVVAGADGRALHAMTTKDYATANTLFDALSSDAATERGPEAAYWWGISTMRETKDSAAALAPWRRIGQHWPQSQWARKVAYALK